MQVLVGDNRLPLDLPSPPKHRVGEGVIFEVPAREASKLLAAKSLTSSFQPRSLAAKVFFKEESKRERKLSALKTTLSWSSKDYAFTGPLELVYSVQTPSIATGYLLPYFDGLLPHFAILRGLRAGTISIGQALHVARNISRAVAAAHRVGVIIGDINESNVGVTKNGTVVVLDTDSFQVRSGTEVFRCTVGRPEYTPPELQGVKFSTVERSTSADAFGLGILIFELLSRGTHPFSAIYTGAGNPLPLPKRIKFGLFPHMTGCVPDYRPKKSGVEFTALPHPIQELFRDCFEGGQRDPRLRPSAEAWCRALDKVDPKDLVPKSCPAKPVAKSGRRNFFNATKGVSLAFVRAQLLTTVLIASSLLLLGGGFFLLPSVWALGSQTESTHSNDSVGKETPELWKEMKSLPKR
jgi:serine/threonine protein kinase